MASIAISGVRKSFGATPVLQGIDLDIRSGEFVVLVGPSGCGKSTLLRLIAGLEELSAGEIRIGDRLVNDLPPKDRDIAMVFQSYALYPHMTVRDNLSYSLRLRRTPRQRIADAVQQAGDLLGLQALQERKPRALSGGQRQRVAMGRAIVRTPKAFLFDEPLSNLDARLREQMRFEIRKLHLDLGATSVYVTHDQIEAMTMADRIVAMNAGVVQQIGAPLELYDDPANVFVAGFIGSPAMNFVEVVAHPGPAGLSLRIGDVELATLAGAIPLNGESRILVGVRPERIALTAVESANLTAVVELVEPTGVGTVVHVRLAGQLLKLFTTDRPALALGDATGLRIAPEDLRLFSPVDGRRLRRSG